MARIFIGNIKGPKGDTGARGATGPQGATGATGPMPPLTNNALATTPGVSALDAVMGKTLDEKIGGVISDLEKQYALADTTYVTDFNNASIAGRYRIYNASGSAAHGPYSGAVEGYVDILTDGNINTTGTKVYQTLHDYLGDVYTRVNVAGTSYGTWKKLTP